MKPIDGMFYVTQWYGSTEFARSDAGRKAYKAFGGIHPGLDFGTKGINLHVVSTCAGKVVKARMDGGWGNHVEILGEDGWRRQYAHLSSTNVSEGDLVKEGDRIGRVGTTGNSTGVHLHYGHRRMTAWGTWEYRNPTFEVEARTELELPKKRLIKSKLESQPAIFVWNGRKRYLIPNWGTKVLLFGTEDWELVEPDLLEKLPRDVDIPNLA